MTLGEYLATIPDETQIAIGMQTAYHYVGPKSHFAEVEPKLSARFRKRLERCKRGIEKEIKRITRRWIVSRPPETIEDKIRRINNTADYFKRLCERKADLLKRLYDYRPLIDLEVLSTAITPISGTTQIIVEGDIPGAVWDAEEYAEYEQTGIRPAPIGVYDRSEREGGESQLPEAVYTLLRQNNPAPPARTE